jgi:hypothetical protein
LENKRKLPAGIDKNLTIEAINHHSSQCIGKNQAADNDNLNVSARLASVIPGTLAKVPETSLLLFNV